MSDSRQREHRRRPRRATASTTRTSSSPRTPSRTATSTTCSTAATPPTTARRGSTPTARPPTRSPIDETIDERIRQEVPDPDSAYGAPDNESGLDDDRVGGDDPDSHRRRGRLARRPRGGRRPRRPPRRGRRGRRTRTTRSRPGPATWASTAPGRRPRRPRCTSSTRSPDEPDEAACRPADARATEPGPARAAGDTLTRMTRSVRDLPKAHLHLHFTGSMRVDTVRDLAATHGIRLPDALVNGLAAAAAEATDERGWFRFQRLYDAARACVRSEADMRRIVREAARGRRGRGVALARDPGRPDVVRPVRRRHHAGPRDRARRGPDGVGRGRDRRGRRRRGESDAPPPRGPHARPARRPPRR